MIRLLSRSKRRRAGAVLAGLVLCSAVAVRLAAQQQPVSTQFQESTSVSIVRVDVTVRDSKGMVVRGLQAKDFTILEDGKPQKIANFEFQDIDATAATAPSDAQVTLLDGLEDKLRADVKRAASAVTPTDNEAIERALAEAKALANRRMWVLLFDVSSMQPEDVQRAVESGMSWVDEEMTNADMVSVVTIGNRLNVLTDFSPVREDVTAALQTLAYSDGTDVNLAAVTTAATDEAANSAAETDPSAGVDAFEEFNNDVRLRALKTLCNTLRGVQQRKAVLYFSAGMTRNGDDNQIELRSATDACNRGNVLIYPVDARGLQAVVAGGGASSRGQTGQGLFTGANATRGFSTLNRSQETLTTLAADTGGRAFTDSNDFGKAFDKVQDDLAAYYLIGYTSTNTAVDGKYRKIQVRLSKEYSNLRVDARDGYYANRSFQNTKKSDREAQLQDQLAASVSSTDVPMVVGTGWFRRSADSYFVPIAMVMPGSSVPVATGAKTVSIDIRAQVRDEQGRTIAQPKATLEIPSDGQETLAGKQVLYQTGVLLPPGRFSVKVVARENTGGAVGSFEAPINIPQMNNNTEMKVSSVVLSTQVQKAPEGKSDNPLVRDGVQLVPNLTRAVARNQNMYFYYEVYDPALTEQAPHVRTSMAFYRGKVKVFETPMVERTMIDEPSRKAVVFQFEVPANSFKPGMYECQINVIDTVGQHVQFPRLNFIVQ
ncbi:MAG TPA: VWA domain-containing protein [Vicinamibacterales bacterium]|nr:VWA domain-containing protein [Vicinamibacterales bacterium]